MDFSDRFELLELLREDALHEDRVRIFRARERATGRAVEAHFASSPELLSDVQGAIDEGSHDGKFYVITAPLDSAGAWRIHPPAQSVPVEAPGDFTRMFQLRQAPEPVEVPESKPVAAPSVASESSQPGAFTRAFQKPTTAPAAAPANSPAPGQPGEFTRMFQQPAATPAPAADPASVQGQPSGPSGKFLSVIVITIAVLLAVAVFIAVRKLY